MLCRLLWVATLGLFACVAPALAATQRGLPDSVVTALDKSRIPPDRISAYVHEVGTGEPVLVFNPDVARNPASVIKLVTTFIGLESLGPTYTWKTQAYATAKPVNGVLDGDLYLKGRGDPFLVLERLWLLVRSLRIEGVREITGDLVIDNSYFDVGDVNPGAFDGRPFNPYNVVPDALLVNFQSVEFLFRPDPVHGRVEIVPEPMPANLQIRNQMQLVDGRCGGKRNQISFTVANPPDHNEITFSGRFSRNCNAYSVSRAVMRGPTFAYGVFRSIWEEGGGKVRGGMRLGTVPPKARVLATLESVPMTDVISSINKLSNNVMARHLLLTLGAERYGAPGTVDKGARAASEFLSRRSLDFPELDIGNGAGLARETRISARSLGRLLLAAERSPYRAEYRSSLALAGLDGTMRKRFRNEEMAGHMHLKTGTLSNVRAIAGYVDGQSGRRYVVVMIQNGAGWGAGAQDALLRWVYRQ
jgi:D-alanyl-D-alanine carboxypeptidase/D-alanyl-D-alanine-endopeptidase (penicillin-binding protein 4)